MNRINLLLLILTFLQTTTFGGTTLFGPAGYLQSSDSPFHGKSYQYFYLEDFEDGLLNTPGVSIDRGGVTSVIYGPTLHDSVDSDDGIIDGSGLLGDSYFARNGYLGLEISFDEHVLGELPTDVGVVWTDGDIGTASFSAFDALGNLLGSIGPVPIGDHLNTGTTVDDRFFGISSTDRISRIIISNSHGGIEIDHIQYGLQPNSIPAPSAVVLLTVGLPGIRMLRRRFYSTV